MNRLHLFWGSRSKLVVRLSVCCGVCKVQKVIVPPSPLTVRICAPAHQPWRKGHWEENSHFSFNAPSFLQSKCGQFVLRQLSCSHVSIPLINAKHLLIAIVSVFAYSVCTHLTTFCVLVLRRCWITAGAAGGSSSQRWTTCDDTVASPESTAVRQKHWQVLNAAES